ncbi:MAG TPA: hypothetical protein VKV26_15345 [Dehalococcoidia bacterium]|nr:hypothetical protein [Dehalococcoidia bacterium]
MAGDAAPDAAPAPRLSRRRASARSVAPPPDERESDDTIGAEAPQPDPPPAAVAAGNGVLPHADAEGSQSVAETTRLSLDAPPAAAAPEAEQPEFVEPPLPAPVRRPARLLPRAEQGVEAPAKPGLIARILAPFTGQKPPRPAPSRALQVAEPAAAPAAARPSRRAMRPLPWGRDFAAAVIRREDSLTAIFGKLDAADSPRVALVAPRGNEELARALGMRRLRRHVDTTGKDVMIVTHSGALRGRAREVGLATVGNVKKVDFERYGRGGVRVGGVIVPLPGVGLIVRLAAFAGAVALLAAAVLLYLPQATVQVYPQLQPFANTLSLTLATDAPALYKPGGEVLAHLQRASITRTIDFPVSGQATVKAPDGSDKQVAAASDDDIKRGTAFAQQVLLREGRKSLEDRNKDQALFQDSATLSAFESKASAKAGEATDLLEITASGQISMLSADKSLLRSVLEQSVAPNVDKNLQFVPDTFQVAVLSAGQFDKANNRIAVQVKLSEGATRAFSVPALRKALAGKSRHDAQQAVVERVDQSAPAKIGVQPGWAPWLPRFTGRIDVKVGTPTPSPTPSPTAAPTPAATPAPR